MALMMGAMTFTSCSNDDDKNNDETAFSVIETTPLVDADNYIVFHPRPLVMFIPPSAISPRDPSVPHQGQA